jgi:DNA-binding NtrC family response regulator
MNSVLLVDLERSLGEILRDMLQEAGYDIVISATVPSALVALQAATKPLLVILSHGGLSHEWERVLTAAPGLPPHGYVLLSTQPGESPRVWNPHTQAVVPVVPMPFDIDLLLTQVAQMFGQLGDGPARTPGHDKV